MNDTVKMIFGLIGGLAMFLYGMENMSGALQKAAGNRMRQVLGFLTRNPVMGALAGALVTAVLQSSSATTVMVIGFVSAGLMSLPQAISVIFGANIGTTMTAQLMAFKISNYIYPIIFIGFIMDFTSKKEKVKNIGMVIFSFGLLFEGIEIMGSVMKPLASSPVFTGLMGTVSNMPVLGILLGAVMTLVVQSSSATIAVLQNFASQAGPDGVTSVIGLSGAIPILLGDNIGTTITALLASIGQSKNAKRTAIAHSIFNISGSIVFACIIPIFATFVRYISPKGPEVEVISRQIANAHTTFNIVCTLVWLPFIPVMVKIVTFIIRGEDKGMSELCEPKYLDLNVLNQPAAALYLVTEEIGRCQESAVAMLGGIVEEIRGMDSALAKEAFDLNLRSVRSLQEAISEYITKLFTGGGLTEPQAESAAGLLYVTNNIERMADRCGEIALTIRGVRDGGKNISADAASELTQCFESVKGLYGQAMASVQQGNLEDASAVGKGRAKLQKFEKKCNKAHLKRVKNKVCDESLTASYSTILYNLERIADNCAAIAEEALDGLDFSVLVVHNEQNTQ